MNGRSFTAGFPVWRGPYHANPTASATADGNGNTGSELDSEYEMETTESENEDGTYEDDARAERHIRVRLDEMELPEWRSARISQEARQTRCWRNRKGEREQAIVLSKGKGEGSPEMTGGHQEPRHLFDQVLPEGSARAAATPRTVHIWGR